MLAGRTARMILVAGLFLAPTAIGARSIDVPTAAAAPLASRQSELIAGSFPARPAQAASIVPFTRWKARPKIVLGEPDPKVVEEVDLGPAFVPVRQSAAARGMWACCPVASASRLRC